MILRLGFRAAAVTTVLLAAACSVDREAQARKYVASGDAYAAKNSRDEAVIQYRNAIKAHPQWAEAVKLIAQGEITPQLASWRLVRVMLEDAFRDMFDTIRHPDLTEGQVPLLLRQMEDTAQDLNQ